MMYSPSPYQIKKQTDDGNLSPQKKGSTILYKPSPDLRRCSDLLFLMYHQNQTSKQNPPNNNSSKILAPKYLIIPNIITPETVKLFQQLLNSTRKPDTLDFDISINSKGYTWDARSESGKAIIGTVHGAAIAFFLLQHKRQFGVREIKMVGVWWEGRCWFQEGMERRWGLWVEIGEVGGGGGGFGGTVRRRDSGF
ncbi:Carboxypeptidase S1 A [Venturia nashicola]|uniref:Carboxypeptidase S1 A n=1 Tax=Venturia nashicola TaxID=86259 RepID=A0A4Z1NLQ7_9PEZI|nr:Carboxypeptidase S1 A [Venturia nashicola]